jgi:Protein of unknown function (DUF2505)
MVIMRTVEVELRYPGRRIEEVRGILADPDFRQAVCTYQGVDDASVTIEEYDDGSMTVDLDRTYGTTMVPQFARKFVGATIDLVQREEWTTPTQANFDVSIPGKPGEMTGKAVLQQSGSDAVETVRMDVRIGIPLVGGKLEDLIAGLIKDAFRAENKVGVKWLAGEWRT